MKQPSPEEKQLVGTVLNIQRMSTEDGPGIRTTVFFKGCTLACYWCHNPESISSKPQVQWLETRCIGCTTCIRTCPRRALSALPEGVAIRRDLCEGCGTCCEECPSTALELLGQKWCVDLLLKEVEKDRAYFEPSGGGISVSGGEPAVQAPFVRAFLQACQERGLHTALDTCGMCTFDTLERLYPFSDLVLFDLKEIDAAKHRRFTGQTNETILANAIATAQYMRARPKPSRLWIRTPIIPGATDTDENVAGIGAFIAEHLADVTERWELCAFNNLCRDKWQRLGETWRCAGEALLPASRMQHLRDIACRSGLKADIVHTTGATRLEGQAIGEIL